MLPRILSYIFIFTVFISSAQEKLGLDDAIKSALQQSKTLKLSATKVELSEDRLEVIKTSALPSIKATAGYTRLSDIDPFLVQLSPNSEPVALFPVILNDYSSRLSLTQGIFRGFKLKYGLLSAEYLQQASKLDYEKDRQQIILNTISSWFNLYKIELSEKLLQENISQVKQHVQDVESMVKAGTASSNDLLRVQLQQSNIELSESDLKNNEEIALYNLKLMLGIPVERLVQIDTAAIFKQEEIKPFDAYLKQAAETRPELKAMDLRNKAAESNLKMIKGNYLPQVNFGANYYFMNPNPRYLPPRDAFKATWDIGINIAFDISSFYTNRKQMAEGAALLKQSMEMQEQLNDEVKMEVNQNFLRYNMSQKKLEIAKKAIEQAEENYRITKSKFSNSVALLSDLLDANVLLLQAKLNYAATLADAEIAYYGILKSTGTLN